MYTLLHHFHLFICNWLSSYSSTLCLVNCNVAVYLQLISSTTPTDKRTCSSQYYMQDAMNSHFLVDADRQNTNEEMNALPALLPPPGVPLRQHQRRRYNVAKTVQLIIKVHSTLRVLYSAVVDLNSRQECFPLTLPHPLWETLSAKKARKSLNPLISCRRRGRRCGSHWLTAHNQQFLENIT